MPPIPTPPPDLQNSSVPLDTAITRIGYWKTAFHGAVEAQGGVPPTFIPQAVFIPIPDIKALADKYEDQYGMKIAGVRAYFALDQPSFGDQIRLLLVPVVEMTENYVASYKDLIIVHHVQQPVVSMETSVYDFTKPCPDFCDTSSILYNAPPPPGK